MSTYTLDNGTTSKSYSSLSDAVMALCDQLKVSPSDLKVTMDDFYCTVALSGEVIGIVYY